MIETPTAPPLSQPVPVETVTPIKPSEALRLGRLIRPVEAEPYETLFGGENRACALGAIAIGYGFDMSRARKHGTEAYQYIAARTGWNYRTGDKFGPDGSLQAIWARFDKARLNNESGDAAVLAYLSERGL